MKTIKKTNIVTDNMVLSLFTGNKSVWKWPWRFKTWKNKINSTKIIFSCYFQYVTTLVVSATTQPSQVVAKPGKVHISGNIGN